ncbi:MAG TPA: VWA domain-containing protein [Candidatus Acidoferrales bacterium]|nr:VWA domain-containing protein [Candidatus Acidoferrales bacterium]
MIGSALARWFAPLLAAAFSLAICGGSAAQDTKTIRSDVNLASVSFTVRDARGALVDNLTKDDFEVFEDAVPQKIAFFARSVDVPLTLGLILDASGSQEHFVKKHRQDLQVFLDDVLGPRDRVFLVCFGNHLRLVSDFTQSGPALLDGFEKYEHNSGKFPEIGPKEDRDLGTAFYDSIYYSVTEKLAAQTGRRALLVFSDGEDNSSSHDMMTTIETAQQENVEVFTIRYTQKEHGRLTARNKYGIRVMDRIAKETGAEAIDAEATDPHTYFRQIAEVLRTAYELAYYPTNPIKDNTFRKIVIRPRQNGLTVRAKTGYFARLAR